MWIWFKTVILNTDGSPRISDGLQGVP